MTHHVVIHHIIMFRELITDMIYPLALALRKKTMHNSFDCSRRTSTVSANLERVWLHNTPLVIHNCPSLHRHCLGSRDLSNVSLVFLSRPCSRNRHTLCNSVFWVIQRTVRLLDNKVSIGDLLWPSNSIARYSWRLFPSSSPTSLVDDVHHSPNRSISSRFSNSP